VHSRRIKGGSDLSAAEISQFVINSQERRQKDNYDIIEGGIKYQK
jgi:hypothetical protein